MRLTEQKYTARSQSKSALFCINKEVLFSNVLSLLLSDLICFRRTQKVLFVPNNTSNFSKKEINFQVAKNLLLTTAIALKKTNDSIVLVNVNLSRQTKSYAQAMVCAPSCPSSDPLCSFCRLHCSRGTDGLMR